MPSDATFGSFEKELNRLVESFGHRLAELKSADYNEAKLRDDFLNPFFRALGWDMENRAGLIQKEREVEIESATQIGGGRKRADYLFRTDKHDRFICEAKKPAEELNARYAFQTKRYAWNKGVWVGILTDFEEFKIYIVGGKPYLDEPHVGEWKSWHFRQYPLLARELWNLLARERVAAGSLEQLIESLPKKPTGKGKARQQWLIKPGRARSLDNDFLEFLDASRRDLASDLYKNNDHAELMEGHQLNEAVQRILDRILFLRICEDRDIDTGSKLQSIVDTWRKNTGHDDIGRRAHQQPLEMREEPPADFGASGMRAPKDSLWRAVVRHFRALDRRPPTHVPFFNGNLFKPHFSETLMVGDEWLAGFISELSDDETPYLFNYIAVEILGSVYERFLGKVVRPHGLGVTIEEKPEVRKAGGVYYTPSYIVDYIVEQTVGKLLDQISGGTSYTSPHSPIEKTEYLGTRITHPSDKDFEKKTAALRLLDPACGSGSFLIRAFERVCDHWQKRLTADLREHMDADGRAGSPLPAAERGETSATPDGAHGVTRPTINHAARAAWQKKHRHLCWLNETTGDLHLTVALKRQILTQNIYGVDLDAAAVEVTQLSLYLKMLENENRTTLQRQRELLADETDIALLPPLQDNIKCGNSLIASDFSMMPEDLVRVHAFDWPVQFAPIMRAGGFDAVIGNPPYVRIQTMQESDAESVEYLNQNYAAAKRGNYDIYVCFVERGLKLIDKNGTLGFILPHKFANSEYGEPLRDIIATGKNLAELVHFGANQVFENATTYTCLMFLKRAEQNSFRFVRVDDLKDWTKTQLATEAPLNAEKVSKASWSFNIGHSSELIDRLKAYKPLLGDVADIFVGLQTSADDVLVLEFVAKRGSLLVLKSKILGEEVELERDFLHPLVSGTDIQGYDSFEGRQFILFPYSVTDWQATLIPFAEIKRKAPKTAKYLEANRKRLEDRESRKFADAEWYRFGRSQNLGIQARKKVCVPRLVDRLCAAYDAKGENYLDNVDVGGVTFKNGFEYHDLRYLTGLLNSKLIAWFFPNVSAPFRGGWMSANRQFLSQIPFRVIDFKKPADKSRHDKLVVLVDKMLGLMPKLRAATVESEKAVLQNAVTATDQQIDQLVYELYGLTAEEIKLVEGNA
jgi:Eco57I restriction-modification methylase/TaqI-like C-terminal specificity domain